MRDSTRFANVIRIVILCSAFSSARAATFNVTTLTDGGPGSLRQAVIDANSNPGSVINLGVNQTYDLTIADPPGGSPPDSDDFALSGDLDIRTDITIHGNGSTIRAPGLAAIGQFATFRIFEVVSAGRLTLDHATITGGHACFEPSQSAGEAPFDGGGIQAHGLGLVLNNVTVTGNSVCGGGGGIANGSAATIDASTISGNRAQTGGGVYNSTSTALVSITASTIAGNTVSQSGSAGAIYNQNSFSSQMTITASTITGSNKSAIVNKGSLTLTNVTLSGNTGDTQFQGGGVFNDNRGSITPSLKRQN